MSPAHGSGVVLGKYFSAPWSPLLLSYVPELWLPPAGISGSPIDSIANAGTAGGSLAASGANRPAVGAINGVACPDFDGSDDRLLGSMLATAVATTTEFHAFVVLELDEWSPNHASPYGEAAVLGNQRVAPSWLMSVRTTSPQADAYVYQGGVPTNTYATGLALSTPALIEWWLTAGTMYLRIADGSAASVAVPNPITDLGYPVILARNDWSGLHINGRIAEAICSKVVYTGADLTNIRAYYARIYGVTV